MEVPARGDYVNSWDTPIDQWATYLDAIRGSTTSISTTGGTTNLTQAQQNVMRITISGTLVSNATINFLNGKGGRWIVTNSTSGAFTVTIASAGGGSSVAVGQGSTYELLHDGTNVIRINAGGTGTVTSVATGTYLSGGPITGSGTINMGTMSATSRLMGSGSASTAITDISVGSGLSLSGTTLSSTAGGGSVTNVATSGYVTGGPITGSGTVSLGTMGAAGRLLGSASTGSAITDIVLGSGLTMSGSSLSASGAGVSSLTAGTFISVSGSTGAVTVSHANLSGTSQLVGSSSGVATATSISLGSGLSMSGSTLSNSGVTSLTGGTFISLSGSTGSVTVNHAALSGNGQLVGSSASSTTATNITLGTGLAIAGTVLSASNTPTASAGVGQFVAVSSAVGSGYSLPAGGNWAYSIYLINNGTGSVSNPAGGVAAGGTAIGSAIASNFWAGFAWRVS